MCEIFYNFLVFVGFYALSCYLYDNLKTPLLLLYRKVSSRFGRECEKSLVERYGKWAAITGSTDGIGKQYARVLAQKGLNIVLISRTEAKLKTVAKEIETEFNVETKIIVADFSKGQEICTHIEKELGDAPIGILINNVGQNTPTPGITFSFTTEDLWHVINTNVGAVTHLSHYFVHRMHSAGIKGIIVNISSGFEMQPIVYAAAYAATKAFTRSLTLSLQQEAIRYGIDFQLVSPNFVVTNINRFLKVVMRGGLLIPDAETYARSAVETIGKVGQTTGYFWHAIETAIVSIVPWRIRFFLSKPIGRYLLSDSQINL